ncbi:hypothetical protein [Mesorhizobium sp. 43Arga]
MRTTYLRRPCRDTRIDHDGKPNIINWLLLAVAIHRRMRDDQSTALPRDFARRAKKALA